ncbi:MAG: hypothetical protein NZ602_06940 [Thermoguttaceae bacterium]|nr:hypothetical protein [Thermoguttaceae bacterium]MDW8037083.1 hypothetical protein [Thermoguttaceae bacterium]
MKENHLDFAPLSSDAQEAALVGYRRPCLWAFGGLVLGVLSFTAVYEQWLYLLPLLGLGCTGLAFWRLTRDETLTGHRAAWGGLVLACFWLAAAPAHWLTMRYLLRQEARQVAELWFDLLRQGQPHKAYQLTLHPKSRHPFDNEEALLEYYRKNPRQHALLWQYIGNVPQRPFQPEGPNLIRTLLALGDKAQIHYVGTEAHRRQDSTEEVLLVYGVSFPLHGQRTTFFVGLDMKRYLLEPDGKASWQIVQAQGGIHPKILDQIRNSSASERQTQ